MPIILKKSGFIENNEWVQSDLMNARELIDIIIRDLERNGETHVNYIDEKLSRAICYLNPTLTLARSFEAEEKENYESEKED